MRTHLFLGILLLASSPDIRAQSNVGIGGTPLRAKFEVWGGAGFANSIGTFGSNGSGISFQQNWPTIGFNQFRLTGEPYPRYMAAGYSAMQFMDPGNGALAMDMQSVSGFTDGQMPGEHRRAFTIFNNGTLSLGKGYFNSNLVVDYLNVGGVNTANGSARFEGTQYHSGINATTVISTQIGPGKDGGTTYINDIPGSKTVIGGGTTLVGVNTDPLYLTSLAIKHATAGNGLLLMHETTLFNWEWYVSTDNPVWIGQKYNGLLIGDYNPTTGQHGYVSDRRVKTNITPLPPVLDKVIALQPVEYRMKSEEAGSALTAGFIAQDVKKLFPELVSIVSDTSKDYKGLPELHMVNYSQFFVLAIKAIQEQQHEIMKLTKEIELIEKSKN